MLKGMIAAATVTLMLGAAPASFAADRQEVVGLAKVVMERSLEASARQDRYVVGVERTNPEDGVMVILVMMTETGDPSVLIRAHYVITAAQSAGSADVPCDVALLDRGAKGAVTVSDWVCTPSTLEQQVFVAHNTQKVFDELLHEASILLGKTKE